MTHTLVLPLLPELWVKCLPGRPWTMLFSHYEPVINGNATKHIVIRNSDFFQVNALIKKPEPRISLDSKNQRTTLFLYLLVFRPDVSFLFPFFSAWNCLMLGSDSLKLTSNAALHFGFQRASGEATVCFHWSKWRVPALMGRTCLKAAVNC